MANLNTNIARRDFVKLLSLSGLGFFLPELKAQSETLTYFHLIEKNGQWILIDPRGEPFYSLALNHIDPASLMYSENEAVWRDKYNNDIIQWLSQKVAPDLHAFGFNSVGWVQEVVTRGKTNHRHSRSFTYEEYQALDMPYCHMLPFADFHQWEAETIYPDFYSQDFADWCDYVARAHCTRYAHDPKLIGYFYLDCPSWIHTVKESDWKGPIFEPEKLKTEAGRQELFELASKYYQVTHDAIRRYDRNHLILGDRYNGQRPWAEEVVKAAANYTDVISVQHFGTAEAIKTDLQKFHKVSDGKPVLLADSGVPDYDTWEQGFFSNDYKRYAALTEMLQELNCCIGFHFCGAYMRNKVRKYGLLAPDESFNHHQQERIKEFNQDLIKVKLNQYTN